MKHLAIGVALLCLGSGTSIAAQASPDSCMAEYAVKQASDYRFSVTDSKPVRQLQPYFFGFNLEWLEFQSALWDKSQGTVKPEALTLLSAFPGAVYRYPGGTNAQYFAWNEATGAAEKRPASKRATWAAPLTINFGPAEYLKFVHDVGGQAWYVANLYGAVGQEQDNKAMIKGAGDLADFMRAQKVAGMPPVLRWELGNELDRDVFHWPPQKLANASVAASQEILKRDPDTKVVAMLEEYPALQSAGISASSYNKVMASQVKDLTDEFAIHLYYDGKPNGPPVKQRLDALCRALDDAHSSGVANPAVWMTEHARVPENAWTKPDWKASWPETANLQAAISVADMLIATAQMPEVKGGMVHALHASDGPWPMFHRSRDGNHIYPSAVFYALQMLRTSMLPEVLHTRSEGANLSSYEGGYDMRATVMTDAAHQHYTAWLINRNGQSANATLVIPTLKGQTISGTMTSLTDESPKANNYLDSQRVKPAAAGVSLKFDASGAAAITLPPYSVNTITLNPKS